MGLGKIGSGNLAVVIETGLKRPPPGFARAVLRRRSGAGLGALVVEPLAQLLAGSEEGCPLLVDRDGFARARVAPQPGRPDLDRESAKTSQLDAVASRQRLDDLIEHRGDNALHVPVVQMRITLRQSRNQFGLDHPPAPKGPGEATR